MLASVAGAPLAGANIPLTTPRAAIACTATAARHAHETRRLIAEFATRARQPGATRALDALTEREREVMSLVAGGLSNDEVAERLVMSPATAKTHVSRAMMKLGARDRAHLVVIAYESGLVRPGWTA